MGILLQQKFGETGEIGWKCTPECNLLVSCRSKIETGPLSQPPNSIILHGAKITPILNLFPCHVNYDIHPPHLWWNSKKKNSECAMCMNNCVVKIGKLVECWFRMQIMCTASGSFKGWVSLGGAALLSDSICFRCFLILIRLIRLTSLVQRGCVLDATEWHCCCMNWAERKQRLSHQTIICVILFLLFYLHNLTFKPNEDTS